MRMRFFSRLGMALIVALAAGCSSPSGQSVSPSLEHATMPLASGHDLLYVASPGYGGSAPGKLRLYTYPEAQHRRTAQADTYPGRSCADKSGNVYITYNTYGSIYGYIEVYAHGHTKPKRGISFFSTYFDFSDCAVDPTSRNLAVTFGGEGGILIFPHAKGAPKYYAYPPNFVDSGCTYDDSGNLFVGGTGKTKRYPLRLYELPPKQRTFINIQLPHIRWPSTTPGDIHWDGKNLAWANGEDSIYRLAVSGSAATIAGVTKLNGAQYPALFWVQGGSIVAPAVGEIKIWNYPSGGNATATIHGFGYVVVSVPPKH